MNDETSPSTGLNSLWVALSALGMVIFSLLTINHFFAANFPETIFKGSFCDISAFFNCDSSAYSPIAHLYGVPLGYFGLAAGLFLFLGLIFPSSAMKKTIRTLALANFLGVIALLLYSLIFQKSLCLLCLGYYLSSILAFLLIWKETPAENIKKINYFFSPSLKITLVAMLLLFGGAYGYHQFYQAKLAAQRGGVAARVVREFYSLEKVPNPSFISPCWTAKATEKFENAPIYIVEYADFLCPDCLYLYYQLEQLKKEYPGKINIAFQFFPLEGKCNQVVDKDFHPGACELSYIAAYDPQKFPAIHDEIFRNFKKAHQPEWRQKLAQKYGVEEALTDEVTHQLVRKIINTGAEYEKTSDRYAHGIRSTPTMIINNRMIIGTLPYPHLKAIVEALLQEQEEKEGPQRFLENWVKTK
jgi:uncharacterized membrane protein